MRLPAQFEAVFADGVTFKRQGPVIVRARPNGLAGARLGIVASRKALRRAVDRNRSKRVLRAAFRECETALPALDIVVQFRDQGAQQRSLTWAEAKALFTALMR